ncbi:hypothetical protein [Sphingomonas sp. 35-24ZXX]|uniref:hypothetical protein n=1 Tax=Sphingomonas sp. 35-24ZXX TaxID=1545915 RepID=UPI0012E02125|nr:hypothetical protein [Sphingomonas sp. 35-24ZXX]
MLIVVFSIWLAGCNSEPTEAYPATCSKRMAELAAKKELIPIMQKIVDRNLRDRGCADLDGLLKDSAALYHFEEDKAQDCQWDFGDESAYAQAYLIIERNSEALAKLCEWSRKDDEMMLERQGQGILQAVPPVDRKALERSYGGT